MDKRFYRFLQATCCNWRNSFFIDCQHCPNCSGFLLSVNHNAVPTIIPVAVRSCLHYWAMHRRQLRLISMDMSSRIIRRSAWRKCEATI